MGLKVRTTPNPRRIFLRGKGAQSRIVIRPSATGGGGVTDHGLLTGLADDDHTQYARTDGSRGAFATTAQGELAETALQTVAGIAVGGALGGTLPNPSLNVESVQDLVAAFAVAGTGITLVYDDALGTLTFSIGALGITDTFVVVDEASMLALNAQKGDVAVRSDLSGTLILAAEPATTLANWVLLPTPTDSVLSVNGQTGVVSITAASLSAAPTSRTINGHPLSGNVTISVGDIAGLQGQIDGKETAGAAAAAQAAAIAAAATDATTKADAKVADAINDGTTTVAPSQNAVFDALALKVPTSRTLAGIDLIDDVTATELRAALGIEWVLLTDETLASNAASWTGPTGLGSYDEVRLVVTGRTTQASSTGTVHLRFNGNSTSGHYINGSGGSSTWLPIGSIAGSLTNTNRWGRLEAIVQNKAGTLHTVSGQYATTEANTSPPNSSHVVYAAGHFTQTAAIDSLTVHSSGSTDFVAGTRFRVFGRL